jgi:exosome complex exonuclease DIS3/RRP44
VRPLDRSRRSSSHTKELFEKNNVVIVGLPEADNISVHAAVDKIFTEKLDLPELAFEARRLGKKVGQGSRPILVQFPDSRSKVSAMKKRSQLKGSNVFMNDDLTPFQKRNNKILLERMKKAREEGKKSYIYKGRLFVDGSSVASLESLEAF